MLKKAAMASVCLLLLVGCSDADSDGAEDQTTSSGGGETTDIAQPDSVTDYFSAIGSPSPSAMAVNSAEGSPARALADFESASAQVRDSMRGGTVVYDLEVDESSVVLCVPPGPSGEEAPDACTTFADFELDDDNKLVDFTVNGEPVESILVAPGSPVVRGGDVSVGLMGGRSQPNGLVLVFNLTAFRDLGVEAADVTYADPGGLVLAADSLAPTGAQVAGSDETYQVRFPGAELGGELSVSPKVDGQVVGTATVPVPAPTG